MHNTPVAEALKKALADTYTLALKTQNFHWNVTGPQFSSLHVLFETQYTDLQAAVDIIAERIRALGVKAPGGFKAFAGLTRISDGDEQAPAESMVRQLRDDQLKIASTFRDVFALAEQYSDDASADLAIERQQQHQKNSWMLSAILGEDAPQG
jgi:starvation-inducible DNA-binding protein